MVLKQRAASLQKEKMQFHLEKCGTLEHALSAPDNEPSFINQSDNAYSSPGFDETPDIQSLALAEMVAEVHPPPLTSLQERLLLARRNLRKNKPPLDMEMAIRRE
jgi:hypothetical protein